MANEEHLAILKKGVKAWNEWRERNIELRPDLSGADLSEPFSREIELHGIKGMREGPNFGNIDFGNADLSRTSLKFAGLMDAHLVGADLSKADLSEATLSGSDLSRANLEHANLSEAELFGTIFNDVELAEANLSRAVIVQTIFDRPRFRKTNFSESTMANAFFGNTDFSAARGLESVKHHAPSTIGIDSIYLSEGNIPETDSGVFHRSDESACSGDGTDSVLFVFHQLFEQG